MCASKAWVRLVEYVPLHRRPLLHSLIWRRDLGGPQFGGVSVGRGSIFTEPRSKSERESALSIAVAHISMCRSAQLGCSAHGGDVKLRAL